ncbi:anti-sigma regulatory factor [Arenibaculum sp.]|uniref:anti-sigma regulatory factor n=1 Tax=Arenibaculum sp. TaxID=2865862 RepID=UPI002E10D570|nr:anti-sigma regulatory factor [Arenibaculum sp.]
MSGEGGPPREALIPIHEASAVGRVRRVVAAAMAEIGASKIEMTRMVTAASELARNTLTHGGGGEVRVAVVGPGNRRKVEVTFVDQGPGIADVALAMTDGYSTGGGLGLGLSGAKRLCKEFHIRSEPGRGTTVRVASWMERR